MKYIKSYESVFSKFFVNKDIKRIIKGINNIIYRNNIDIPTLKHFLNWEYKSKDFVIYTLFPSLLN